MSKYILPPGVVKACAGIVEGVAAEPYASNGYITQADALRALGKYSDVSGTSTTSGWGGLYEP